MVVHVSLDTSESNETPIHHNKRQDDTISPKPVAATLEDMFRDLDWNDRGISINGGQLSNIRFADDVTVIAENLQELELDLNKLSAVSKQKVSKST